MNGNNVILADVVKLGELRPNALNVHLQLSERLTGSQAGHALKSREGRSPSARER